jgi:sulfotransferase family protein
MALELVTDELIEGAQRRTGLERFDRETFREGLAILVSDVNRDERPEPLVQRTREAFVKALADRLKTTAYLEGRPELLRRPIQRPIFVFGIPRTGTTLLSNLLGADPAHRSPLTWEIDDPIPPPTTAALYTDPRALARLEAERQLLAARPDAGKYYRGSAIYPNECVFIMAHDFKTLMWESRGKLPNYRDWIFQTDVTSAYEYHKRFLQLLQADAPGIWNLKMPSHALNIPTLLKIYPDARLIWTHRDPITATGSFCSLLTLAHQGFRGNVDVEWLGQNCPWQAAQHANRIMDARAALGEDRIIDVHYADLMRNPIETMRKVYGGLGDEFTGAAETGMRSWLADNPQDKFGKHEYKLARFGLSQQTLAPLFERYLSHYDVEPEGF